MSLMRPAEGGESYKAGIFPIKRKSSPGVRTSVDRQILLMRPAEGGESYKTGIFLIE